jgi:hypothetical protein
LATVTRATRLSPPLGVAVLDHVREQVPDRFRTLRCVSDIPTLLASIDARLDELAAEISALESGRAALGTPTPAAPPPNGVARRKRRRLTRATTTPEPKPTAPATDPKPEFAAAVANGASSEAPTPRRRAAATAAPKQRSVASLTAEQLERLLAEVTSGLSAGAIAERAGVSYSRVLARLRELEAAGRVRRTGIRRSTLWLVITDEERIAQRAAELERLAGARRDDRTQRRGRARAS